MNFTQIRTSLVLLGVATSGIAAAQARIWSMDETRTGDGRLSILGSSNNYVNRARVQLRSGGEFTITVYGARTETFHGRWFSGFGDDVDLRVTSGLGSPSTNGSGSLRVRGSGDFERIELNGKSRGRVYGLDFRTQGRSSSRIDFSRAHSGSGEYDVPGVMNARIRRATVTLRRDGRCEIEIETRNRHRFSGRWSDAGNDRVRVDLTGELDNRRVTLRGTVYLSDRQRDWRRFDLSGERAGRRMTMTFRV